MAVQENPRSKLVVSFPVFRGDESEDVFDFLDNFKRAATLNGWSNEAFAIGLPLYLKGHASAWFKSLGNVDGKTFDQLKALMTEHFASGASAWRIRQTLGQQRQLEKEPVSEYSYSVRMHCERLYLPTSEWTHYFVQGLKPEIRDMLFYNHCNALVCCYGYLTSEVRKSLQDCLTHLNTAHSGHRYSVVRLVSKQGRQKASFD